jgi:hypothetical protein
MVIFSVGYSVEIQPVEATLIGQITGAGLPAPTSVAIGVTFPYSVDLGFDVALTTPQQVTLDGVITTNYTAAPPAALPLPFTYNVRNKVRWQKAPGLAVPDISPIGASALPTTSGTASVLAGATGQWLQYTSSALIGATAGWDGPVGYDLTQRRWRPSIGATVRSGTSIVDLRVWVGLFSQDPSGSDDPAGHLVGLRYSSAVGPNWFLCTKDGVTLTAIDTGLPFAANTRYEIAISLSDEPSVAAIMQITTGGGNTATLVLPASDSTPPVLTQSLGIAAKATTLAAVAKEMRISYVEVETA